jgi:hypothetical protein
MSLTHDGWDGNDVWFVTRKKTELALCAHRFLMRMGLRGVKWVGIYLGLTEIGCTFIRLLAQRPAIPLKQTFFQKQNWILHWDDFAERCEQRMPAI